MFVAVALSMIDMFTDILMVFEFMLAKKTGFSYTMMGSIFANLGIQLLTVFIQNFKLGWRKVLKEMLIILTCTKPGFDAFRVASEKEIVEVHVISPKSEFTATKCSELFTEAIPGTIVQLTAIVSPGSDTSSSAAFSFVCFVFTAAFASSYISYDWDTGRVLRKGEDERGANDGCAEGCPVP